MQVITADMIEMEVRNVEARLAENNTDGEWAQMLRRLQHDPISVGRISGPSRNPDQANSIKKTAAQSGAKAILTMTQYGRNEMATRTDTVQTNGLQTSKLQSAGGLVAVGMGIGAILALALATVFLLALAVSAPTDAVVAVATGAFGVIGSVVGAYFGVKVGTDQAKPMADAAANATEDAATAHARSEAIALHVPPADAERASDAANAAVTALRGTP